MFVYGAIWIFEIFPLLCQALVCFQALARLFLYLLISVCFLTTAELGEEMHVLKFEQTTDMYIYEYIYRYCLEDYNSSIVC
jgi:hypothetical protein